MTLTPEDRARLQAEEAYRAQLRAQEAARRRGGCWKWALGLLAVPVLLFVGLYVWAQVDPAPPDPRTVFVVECERQVKAALKAPSTASISNAFSDGILTTSSGYAWNGEVDAENGFGANIRTAFRCQGPPDSPTVTF